MISLYDDQSGTNTALLREIARRSNAPGWATFFETYAPMIERFAMKSGLTALESQEVVQNTMIQVMKSLEHYDRAKGSFKNWLFNNAKWRIQDAYRLRPKDTMDFRRAARSDDEDTARSWEPSVSVFEDIWDVEWDEHLLREAMEEVRKQVSAAHFQIFCLNVLDDLPAAKVAAMVGVSTPRVHLIKCRVGAKIRKQLALFKKQP